MVKIGVVTFICRPGIPKRVGLSPYRFHKDRWQLLVYIICKFGEIRSSNSGV